MSAVQPQVYAVHDAEKLLKAKIHNLQDQMVSFNKQLHTTREDVDNDSFCLPVADSQPDTWLSTGIASAAKAVCGLFCLLIYITWPLLLTLLVYFKEGGSFLFWKLLCLAILYVVAFTLKVAIELRGTILQLISEVFSGIKTHYNNCFLKIADLKTFLLLWTERLAESTCYKGLFSVCMPAVGCTIIVLLLGAAVTVTIVTNMAYFPSGMIFFAGLASGLIITSSVLKPQRNSLLPFISKCADETLTVPYINVQCSEDCTKLLCHSPAANSGYNLNLPRTPPPTYQEALLSSLKVDFSSECRTLYCEMTDV